MVSAKYNAHTNDLFNELGILKLDDVHKLKYEKRISFTYYEDMTYKLTIPDQTQNTEYNHKRMFAHTSFTSRYNRLLLGGYGAMELSPNRG